MGYVILRGCPRFLNVMESWDDGDGWYGWPGVCDMWRSRYGSIHYTSKSKAADDGTIVTSSDNRFLPSATCARTDDEMHYCYEVLYGKISSRTHKRWQDDGLLLCRERSVILQAENGEEVARASGYSIKQLSELKKGSRLKVNNYELEIQAERSPRQPADIVVKNIERQWEADELARNDATEGDDKRKRKKIADQNFISPLFGRDDPSDFVLDETKDEKGSLRRIAVDVRIARYLRPHQKNGIVFLYKNLKDSDGGVILADEMGLGKSVQTISLITALIKRRLNQKPIIQKCMIVVPTSLLNNWYAEFIKWSPQTQALLFRVTNSTDVEKLISYPKLSVVIIISYEMVTRTAAKLSAMPIDLLVCDEAHRLKNLNGRLREQLQSLHVQRRLLLTGTPMQNDLEEFYSLVKFARPDLFGSFSEFKQSCEIEPTCFNGLLAEVMLRRTAEVNHEWLPPKNDYIVWCRPSPLQCSIYKRLKKFLTYDHLTLIDILRKLCNHPSILYQSILAKLHTCKIEEKEFYTALLRLFPDSYSDFFLSIADSGKLSVFGELLGSFREQDERVVVVSNFTKTLDLLEELCRNLFYTVLRLDGSTEPKKRMEIVEEFNSLSGTNCAFLLSAKAGGLGLNLIGASRMILFDSDWNPAVDMQAMARIWRQGQKKPCHIYRLITGGTVDEKILQRQIKKSSLSTVVEMVPVESLTHFSDEELQDIFTLRDEAECETHCLLECQCDGCGVLPEEYEVDQEISSDKNSPKLDVEHITGCSGRIIENVPRTSIPEDSVESIDDSLIEDCSKSFCSNSNEMLNESENKAHADDGLISGSALMGTLMRWRHYSPKHEKQFELMKSQSGLQECCLEENDKFGKWTVRTKTCINVTRNKRRESSVQKDFESGRAGIVTETPICNSNFKNTSGKREQLAFKANVNYMELKGLRRRRLEAIAVIR
uniref:DNA repair and recombination protein RAD54-like n=1 Tax=Setaria digitata TaxID=48799 RepID=A0A915PWM0_9BILA